MGWIAYEELAWMESLLCPPEECEEECRELCDRIKGLARNDCRTLLHLGSGAGLFDFTYKKHFAVTGVDISGGMLAEARKLNPSVHYVQADMRSVRLREQFDAVIIPDAVDYMVTEDDLRSALMTVSAHLKRGGLFAVDAHTSESFRENNFVYSGAGEGIQVTLFENNYVPALNPTTYEAVLCYLIRRAGELEIRHERHVLGLHGREVWLRLFREQGLELREAIDKDSYEDSILGEGEHPVTVFFCEKA